MTELVRCIGSGSMDAETLQRWGLSNSHPSDIGADNRYYQIRRVVLPSGDVNGWEKGRYYGSSDGIGGPQTFYLIEFHSLSISTTVRDIPGSPI